MVPHQGAEGNHHACFHADLGSHVLEWGSPEGQEAVEARSEHAVAERVVAECVVAERVVAERIHSGRGKSKRRRSKAWNRECAQLRKSPTAWDDRGCASAGEGVWARSTRDRELEEAAASAPCAAMRSF